MSYTITTTDLKGNAWTTTAQSGVEARNVAEGVFAEYLNQGIVTGGQIGDWANMTLYVGSPDEVVTIVTKRVDA